jgi:membrane protein EpsK
MQSSNNEAKKRIVQNVSTNVLAVLISGIVGIWLIPYLIRHLGVEVYGMIPLVVSFTTYFNLFTMSISNTLRRFITIHLGRDELEQSNLYFSSAFYALVIVCGMLLVPVIALSVSFSRIFQVPAGFETDASWLFFLVASSSLVMSVTSPFLIGTFVTHRFDLSNGVRILGKFLQVIIIVLCFKYLSPSLEYFGLSILAMSFFVMACSVLLTRFLTPQLRVNVNLFNWSALREMGHMSVWITVSQVGALLYLSVSFVVINVFLGPEQVGWYGPIALWVVLLVSLGVAISSVFAPIAYEYIARNDIEGIVRQTKRATKFVGMCLALPVGLLCGLSTPLLERWLGASFSELSPLVWVLVGPRVVTMAVMPMLDINKGMNKVRMPAIITITGGLTSVVVSIVLVLFTELGIYGVAMASMLCLVAMNVLFVPIYCAMITGARKSVFYKEMLPGVVLAAEVALLGLTMSWMYNLASVPRLLGSGALLSGIFAVTCYGVAMNGDDRRFLRSQLHRSLWGASSVKD